MNASSDARSIAGRAVRAQDAVISCLTLSRMRRQSLLSLSILIGGCALAQDVDFAPATRLPPLQAQVNGPEAYYAIATRRDRIGRIVAPVMINGQGPFHFMLDTGATRTALALSLTQKLKLPVDLQSRVSVTGVAGSAAVGTAMVAQLRTGDMLLSNQRLPVLSGLVLDGIDGILGMDGLDNKRVTADFVHDRLVIVVSPNHRPEFGRSVIPVEFLSDRLLLATGRVGQIRTRIVIDTGGTHTLGNKALYDALIHGNAIQGWEFATSVTDVIEASQLGTIRHTPLLRLGNSMINNVNVTFGDFHVFKAWNLTAEPAMLVGMDVLGTLAELTIDYRRKELEILPL